MGRRLFKGRRLLSRSLGVLGLGLGLLSSGHAAGYPDHPIHLVVAYAPGGGTDIAARLVAEQLGKKLGQSVIVENRPGASGMIGAAYVARADPDGYTLFVATQTTQAVDPALYKDVAKYDGERDFTSISLVAQTPLMLMVNPAVPAKSVPELIAYLRGQPGKLDYATVGKGSTPHMAGELFKEMAHVDVVPVPFKGEGPAIEEVLSGRLAYMFCDVPVGMPFMQGGRLKALGVTSPHPSKVAPGVPAIAEAGLPGYDAVTWFGLFGPARLPPAIVQKLNTAMQSLAGSPELSEKFAKIGYETHPTSVEAFAAFVRNEQHKWAKVVQDTGMTPD